MHAILGQMYPHVVFYRCRLALISNEFDTFKSFHDVILLEQNGVIFVVAAAEVAALGCCSIRGYSPSNDQNWVSK